MASSLFPERESNGFLKDERGSSRNILLIALLILVAVFGYLYLFTDLIRSQEGSKTQPQQVTQVKKPIPQRPDQGAPTQAQQPKAETGAPKPTAQTPPPAAPAQQVAKPAAAPQPAPAAPTPAKPAATPQPVAKPAAPAAAKPQAAAVATKPPQKEQKKVSKAAYTILVGEFVLDKSIQHEKALLKKLGIGPVRQSTVKRLEPMTRLKLSAHNDREEAVAQLAKLKTVYGDGFMLPEGGKYIVYAGSFFLEGPAAKAQDRLYDKGFKTVMVKTKVPVPVVRLTAGGFASQEDAQKAVALLQKKGVKARILATGK
jgi:type IV secretory pathway VirB10-like protein